MGPPSSVLGEIWRGRSLRPSTVVGRASIPRRGRSRASAAYQGLPAGQLDRRRGGTSRFVAWRLQQGRVCRRSSLGFAPGPFSATLTLLLPRGSCGHLRVLRSAPRSRRSHHPEPGGSPGGSSVAGRARRHFLTKESLPAAMNSLNVLFRDFGRGRATHSPRRFKSGAQPALLAASHCLRSAKLRITSCFNAL